MKKQMTVLMALGLTVSAVTPWLWAPASGGQRGKGPNEYSIKTIKGRWGFFDEHRVGRRYGTSLGIISFDGRGGCDVRGMTNGGATLGATRYSGKCDYTLEKTGRGTITGSGIPDLSLVMTEHGRGIAFVRAERGEYGHGEMRRIKREPLSRESLAGTWSFIHPAELFDQYDMSVGTVEFDGSGTCSFAYSQNGFYSANGATDQGFECEYDVERSGWGVIGDAAGFGGPDYLVVGDDRIYYMHGQPGNVGWAELTRI